VGKRRTAEVRVQAKTIVRIGLRCGKDDKETGDEIVSDEWKLQHHVWDESAHSIEHPSQAQPGVQAFPDRLHVVTMLENPLRWHSRYWNYGCSSTSCAGGGGGAILYTAEVAFGERQFEVTQAANPRHLPIADGA